MGSEFRHKSIAEFKYEMPRGWLPSGDDEYAANERRDAFASATDVQLADELINAFAKAPDDDERGAPISAFDRFRVTNAFRAMRAKQSEADKAAA
jgi:hypothetical protein